MVRVDKVVVSYTRDSEFDSSHQPCKLLYIDSYKIYFQNGVLVL